MPLDGSELNNEDVNQVPRGPQESESDWRWLTPRDCWIFNVGWVFGFVTGWLIWG